MVNEIIVFNSTHQALKTEDKLRDENVDFEVVPLPKEFSADCGLAIEFSETDRHKVEEALSRNKIKIKGIYSSPY